MSCRKSVISYTRPRRGSGLSDNEKYDWDADPDEYKEEEQEWVDEADPTMETTMNGVRSFHKMTSIWRNTFLPQQNWENAAYEIKRSSKQFHGRQKVGGSSKCSRRFLSSGWLSTACNH